MKRFATGLIVLAGAAGCSQAEETIRVVFPDAATRSATSDLAVTVFEPFIDETGEPGRFLGCEEIGTFVPTSRLAPSGIGGAGTGQTVVERLPIRFSDGFSTSVDLPVLSETSRNPWGALTVLVEARGDAFGRGGNRVAQTVAQGCRCVRTLDGSHPDAALDTRVKQTCAPLGVAGPSGPAIELGPVASRAFPLEPCGGDQINGPTDAVTVPGALACLRPVLCRQNPEAPDCFDCDGACPELEALGRVPVQFEVEGGGVGPRSFLATTDDEGVAEARFDLAGCTGDYEVVARVLGRRDEQVRFQGSCVSPPSPYRCIGEVPLGDAGSVAALSAVAGPPGRPDAVAVLQSPAMDETELRVVDVVSGSILARRRFAGEDARGLHGFEYGDGRALLAVATGDSGGAARIRVFDWSGSGLTSTATLTAPCSTWTCGSLQPCPPEGCPEGESCLQGRCVEEDETSGLACSAPGPVACGCALNLVFGSKIRFATADVDGDGLADLAAASDDGASVTVWLSSGAAGEGAYAEGACRCSKHGLQPRDLAFGRLGGTETGEEGSELDLALADDGGTTYLVFGQSFPEGSVFQCGGRRRLGEFALVRRIATGRFSCPRDAPESACPPYDDLVVLPVLGQDATPTGPEQIRVAFGGPFSFDSLLDVFSFSGRSLDLLARDVALDPRDVDVVDVNVDGHEDLAILYTGTKEVRVWLGASNRGFGELAEPIALDRCDRSLNPATDCTPLDELAVPDLDADGGADMVVVCDALNEQARLRSFRSSR